MSDMWKNWEGQVADHKYQLMRFLGSTDHSVVFLAEFHDPDPRQAAIKFVSADFAGKEQQLETWKATAQLTHSNLLRIYGSGSCKIDDTDLLYVATEYAEENLAQVLPHRALTAEETTEMLNAVVNALLFLHGRGLVHGHIKPSNVLATSDHLKLSSDTIMPAGELREMRRQRSAYDPPELPTSPYTGAADIWSLGVTLVEACTQQPAVLPFNERAEPIVPSTMPEKFLEIARETLRRDPSARWSTAKIAEQLNLPPLVKAAAAAAGAFAPAPVASPSTTVSTAPVPPPARPSPAISPLDVPLSKEPAVPLNKLPHAPTKHHERALPPLRTDSPKQQTVELPNYVLPLFASALGVIALIVLFFVLHPRTRPEVNASASVSNPPANTVPSANTANTHTTSRSTPVTKPPVRQATPANVPPQKPAASAAPAEPTASAASNVSTANPPLITGAATKKLSSDSDQGEALDQVIPQASPKALATIHGTVRVAVKVQVDPAGRVSDATLDSPGPSHYFADLALKAARQWVFTPPETDGHSAPSQWLIEFGFTNEGAKATASQLEP